MSWLSKLTGRDAARSRHAEKQQFWRSRGGDPNERFNRAIIEEGDGGGWEPAFERTAGAFMSRALPQLREGLQLTRENNIARGISTGDLGTSYEGDLVNAWGKNLADTLGGMAMEGYESSRNRYLDLITGRMDRDDSSRNWWKNALSGLAGAGGQAAAAYYGGRRGGG